MTTRAKDAGGPPQDTLRAACARIADQAEAEVITPQTIASMLRKALRDTGLSPGSIALQAAADLRRARGILADVAHHSDADVATACVAIKAFSQCAEEKARATDMLALIEGEAA